MKTKTHSRNTPNSDAHRRAKKQRLSSQSSPHMIAAQSLLLLYKSDEKRQVEKNPARAEQTAPTINDTATKP